MRTAKEVLNERKQIEEKLTQSEIAYNKISYKQKEIKRKINSLEKESDRTTPEHIKKYEDRIKSLKDELSKQKKKLIKIQNKKYEDISLKKQINDIKKGKLNDVISSDEIELMIKKLSHQKKIKDNHEWKDLKKSHIFNKKKKIADLKRNINFLNKKISKYKRMSKDKYLELISKNNSKLELLEPDLKQKKLSVSKYRKKYKSLLKEWTEIFPDEDDSILISVKGLNIFYGDKIAIKDVNIDFPKNKVISIIGPSGCGKSTFLKTLNRINDEIASFKATGQILFQNEIDILSLTNIHDPSMKITLPELRTRIGMVFQQPNPFPMSIFNNVAYGPRINGIKNKAVLKEIVNDSLRSAALYEQVKDNLNIMATGLSGGQQQRLCIARAIANKPNILLMDEPTSALDPIAAKKVEDLILELKKDYTILVVTHSMQQASRISDKTAFFYQGELIEYGDTDQIFNNPKEKKTEEYISGKFG